MTKNTKLDAKTTVFSWLLMLNGAIGLVFDMVLASQVGLASAFLASTLAVVGLASGVASLRGKSIGLFVGTLFYLVQTIRYYAPGLNFGFVSGLQAGISFQPIDGETLVVNFGAITGTLYGLFVLNDAWARAKLDSPEASVSTRA